MATCNAQPSNSKASVQDLIPVLQRFDKNSRHNDIHVTKNQFTIGRARENDEVICSVLISRNHCIFKCNDNGDWIIENLSFSGTVLNGQLLGQNVSKSISLGDVVQFAGDYKYFFTLRFRDELPVKRLKTEESTRNVAISKIFAHYQKSKREEIEEELELKKEEQKDLKLLLAENLQRQHTENDSMMTERLSCLRRAIESTDKMVKILEGTYQRYLSGMDDERIEFDTKLAKERKKVQRELNASDEQVERVIGKKMDTWTREHQSKWSEIMKSMMKEVKVKHERLESENSNLTAKLKRTEDALELTKEALREKSALAKQLEQQQILQMIDVEKDTLRDKVENIFDEQLSCSICSEIFVNPTSLNCSHTFCEYCISSWKKKNKKPNCPICRVRIKAMNQSRVFDSLIEKIVSELSFEFKQRREQLINERRQMRMDCGKM